MILLVLKTVWFWDLILWINDKDIDGLVQDCSISSMLAMEILQSCTKPSICPPVQVLIPYICRTRAKNFFITVPIMVTIYQQAQSFYGSLRFDMHWSDDMIQNGPKCQMAIPHLQFSAVGFNNQLWPSDAIWWHRSGSVILAQVVACCLTAQVIMQNCPEPCRLLELTSKSIVIHCPKCSWTCCNMPRDPLHQTLWLVQPRGLSVRRASNLMNGLLLDCTKPLPEPVLTYHQMYIVEFIWELFPKNYSCIHF